MQVFAWHCVFTSAPEMGSCRRDGWLLANPPATLVHQLARTSSSPSSGRSFLSISIIGLSCIHLSADALWYEVAGRRSTEAFLLQVPSLPISPLLLISLLSSFFIWLCSSFLPIWPLHRQVRADTHNEHTRIVTSVKRTHSAFCIAIGKCVKVCICVEPLAPESTSRSLKHCLQRRIYFFVTFSF